MLTSLALSSVMLLKSEQPLDGLSLSGMTSGWGTPQRDLSISQKPLSVAGKKFDHGIGTHAESTWTLDLGGKAESFDALVGIDDDTEQKGSVEFVVKGDGKVIWRSGVMLSGAPAKPVHVGLKGVRRLQLIVTDGGDDINYDHADWLNPVIASPVKVKFVEYPPDLPVILSPAPGPQPKVTGPRVFGVRPDHPLAFRLTASGEKPIRWRVDDLPNWMKLDRETGEITGKPLLPGEWTLTCQAENGKGTAKRELKIVCGDQIALTPPMGWNSWYCFYDKVTQANVLKAAQTMASSGLADHGYSFVNIDDGWQVKQGSPDPMLNGPVRDAEKLIIPNKKFPDMKALVSSIHDLGLRAGVYSSPGPTTCAGFHGSYTCEAQDVQQWSNWGFDLIKYDWCSYGEIAPKPNLEELQKPYKLMRDCLARSNRDIIFSLCQYGMGDVWEWGASVGGNMWRTTGDMTDSWSQMSSIGFSQDKAAAFAGPGHWNDPDMLQIGNFVLPDGTLRKTRLLPSEQRTQMTLWCLLSAPLIISCDIASLDDFSKSLLMNDEVLDIDQDPLGSSARLFSKKGDGEVWVKKLADGTLAIGLFNLGDEPIGVDVKMSELGFRSASMVRDLWRQKKVQVRATKVGAQLGRHGCALFKVWPTGSAG